MPLLSPPTENVVNKCNCSPNDVFITLPSLPVPALVSLGRHGIIQRLCPLLYMVSEIKYEDITGKLMTKHQEKIKDNTKIPKTDSGLVVSRHGLSNNWLIYV